MAEPTSDYGRLPTLYARATAFLVRELMQRGMSREAAEQKALEMLLAQAADMKTALGALAQREGE